jgi:serine/threonine protein kinase
MSTQTSEGAPATTATATATATTTTAATAAPAVVVVPVAPLVVGVTAQKEAPGGDDTTVSTSTVSTDIETKGDLSQYTLGKVLGQGSYGVVRLATHVPTGNPVAIKICNLSKASKKTRDNLLREVGIMKRLDHPNILKLKDVILTSLRLCLVVEYVEGGELFDYIVAHQRIEESRAKKMFQQICQGVHYCHSREIVHRDLKAENILLDADLNVKIIDFGFSKALESHQALQTRCGSPHYTAPEINQIEPLYGLECDIWSLGVVLFAMLVGYLPFDDKDEMVISRLAKNMEYTIPKFVSDDARDLVTRMLIADPTKRITMAEILDHPWVGLKTIQLSNTERFKLEMNARGDNPLNRLKAGANTRTRAGSTHSAVSTVRSKMAALGARLAADKHGVDPKTASTGPSPQTPAEVQVTLT